MTKGRTDHQLKTKQSRFREMPIEYIEWIDSNFTGRWDTKEIYDEQVKLPFLCRSVGFVLHESDDRVALLQSEADSSFSNAITIPKLAITKRRRLKIHHE